MLMAVGVAIYVYAQTLEPVETLQVEYEALVTLPNGSVVYADVADSTPERTRGLSGREALKPFEGMLFVHDQLEVPNYWMPDMNFSIDIIWLVDDEIVGFSKNAIPEDPAQTYYSPEIPINMVLEVNAGFVEENELIVGDFLDIEFVEE